MLETYIITLDQVSKHRQARRNQQVSQSRAVMVENSLDQHGWPHRRWPATDGYGLTDQAWTDLNLRLLDRGAIVKRPGAQGCFFSHYRLWQHCCEIAQPIIVLEHDSMVLGPQPQLDLDQCIWKLHVPTDIRINTITGEWSTGAYGYTLTPAQAQQLIAFTQVHGVQAADKQIGRAAVAWQFVKTPVVKHYPKKISTTSPKISK